MELRYWKYSKGSKLTLIFPHNLNLMFHLSSTHNYNIPLQAWLFQMGAKNN